MKTLTSTIVLQAALIIACIALVYCNDDADRLGRQRDRQTYIVQKELDAVNNEFDDDSREEDKEFFEDMRSFDESDVITLKGTAPEKRRAQARGLGGFVLNLGQFTNGEYIPANVFGKRHETHLVDSECQPLGFPYICELRDMIEPRFKCPVDVPYCQRIPCGNKAELNQDRTKCLKQPGCCFDQVLHNYRRYYGQTVLPQVPVCHMAVRNEFFHTMARAFAAKFRGWNPLLTSCLIKSNRNRIEKNVLECATLDILEYFGYKAKHAGWKDILPKECGLIGGCWRPGFGCFYPPRMTHLQLRSSYEHPRSRPYSPFDLYGQPVCLPMDPYADSELFLDQYHQCLAAGCQLDPAVTPTVILNHLYNLSSQLPSHIVNSFKYEIMVGNVRPDNWKKQLNNFAKYGRVHPHAFTPRQGGPRAQPNLPPKIMTLLGKFPGQNVQSTNLVYPRNPQPPPSHFQRSMVPYPRQTPVTHPFQMINQITSGRRTPFQVQPSNFRNPNPNAFISARTFGQRSSMGKPFPFQQQHPGSHIFAPTNSQIVLYPVPCPYTIVRIPNFPPLNGKMDGCCDRNLCYLPRDSVRQQYSGAAAYWGPWGFWSRCSFSCGNALQKRYRTCIGPDPTSCAGPREDRKACYNLPNCRKNISKWSQWSACEKSCGGNRVRTRNCLVQTCQDSLRERQPCPKQCSSKKDDNKRSKDRNTS